MSLADELRALGAEPLKALLARRHPDAAGDFGARWWDLVRQSYEHGPAFRASLEPDASVQGEASYASGTRRDRVSYLRRFPREHEDTYARRIASSTYENHVAPVVDVFCGHLLRRAPSRTSDVPAVSSWWASADVAGADVQRFIETGVRRAALVGWAAVIFDRSADVVDRASARTVARWLEPEELRDWEVAPDGRFQWARLGSLYRERSPGGGSVLVEDVTVWTRSEWARVVVRTDETTERSTVSVDGAEHGLGRVPVAVLHWQRPLTARLYGVSLVNDVVPLNLALFNRRSELTHHLRSAVFALLCVQSNDPEIFATLKLGTNNGLRYPEGTAAPAFIAPPADVASTLAAECDRLKDAIYVAAKIERPRAEASGGDAASGIARSYDFAGTDAVLAGAVANIATFEYEAAELVALWDAAPVRDPAAVSAAVSAATRITYPTTFDVAGLARDLDAAFAVLDPMRVEQMLPGARREARSRIARAMLPDAGDAELASLATESELLYQRDMGLAAPDSAEPRFAQGGTTAPESR